MKKKFVITGVLGMIITIILVIVLIMLGKNSSDKYISRAHASKMLVLLETDVDGANATLDNNLFMESASEWYVKYLNYMYINKYLSEDRVEPTEDNAMAAYTYEDLREYLDARKIDTSSIEEATDMDIEGAKGSERVSKRDFNEIYDYLVIVYGSDATLHQKELTVVGTPANIEGAKEWQAYTTDGNYTFEGLTLDGYIDKKISVYVRGSEIVSFIALVSDEVVYENAWIEYGRDNLLRVYVGNVEREFVVNSLSQNIENVMGDISVKNRKVLSVSVKKDTINGKVLMIDKNHVEIQGYGVLELTGNFRAYKNYGVIEQMSINDILVGYDLADFVVAEGKVCGAIIKRELTADNIRVLIMTTNHASVLHDRVTITGSGDFIMHYGDNQKTFKAGEIVDIYPGSEYFAEGRISFESVDTNSRLKILTVERSYGNPEYRGTIEIANFDGKLAVINDVLLEEYLYAVVPSEMPVTYGVEALKVQAICARTYAYRQLLNNAYSKYGAHVDDSVSFQVYNNVSEQPDSTQAVRETYGEVLEMNDKVVTTYYYSTSCGHTSDISAWCSDPSAFPYLPSKTVNSAGSDLDLSDEATFENYIKTTNASDFDNPFPYYRWKVNLSLQDITNSINANLASRYAQESGRILTLDENGRYVSREINTIGTLTRIEVVSRTKGGAINCAIFHGSQATIKVMSELNIRYLLSPGQCELTLNDGSMTTFYILPSAYCVLDDIYDANGSFTGYSITGGGYGHGIGMGQNAVSVMVKQGMKYDDIIYFFYPGTELKSVY